MELASGWVPPKGATEGPLRDLIPVFVDVETYVDESTSLSSMTLRQYLARTHMTALAVAVGDEEPDVMDFPGGALTEKGEQTLKVLEQLALDARYVFVAHNAAFDIRALRFLCGIPQPCNVWCTMEGAMGAWPDLPGGYGLDNCGRSLALPKTKLELDLSQLGKLRHVVEKRKDTLLPSTDLTPDMREQLVKVLKAAKMKLPDTISEDLLDDVLMIYNKRDVETMQELYYRQVAMIPEKEQRIALMTHRVRRNHFKVKPDGLESLIQSLTKAAEDAEEKAEEYVSDDSDIRQIFNRDQDGTLQSIRYQRLKNVIQTKMDAPHISSTSAKKINPVHLAGHQDVAGLLEQTARASKMIFHRRRAEVFRNVDEVDAELGYMRAITGRFSSPSVGRGLNLHNCVPGNTPVLTDRGWVPIRDITEIDLVWDGMHMVRHRGVTHEGKRKAATTLGLSLTLEHPIWTGRRMVAIGYSTPCQRALALVAGCLSNLRRLHTGDFSSVVCPAEIDDWASSTSSAQPDATDVSTVNARRSLLSYLETICETFTSVGVSTCSTATGLAGTLSSMDERTKWSKSAVTANSSSAIARLCLDGMAWLLRWIGLTWGSLTDPTMSDLYRAWSTRATDATRSLLAASHSSESHANVESLVSVHTTCTARDVFDLRDCGKFQTPLVLISNCPKHDKAVAKPVRQLFRLPDHLCGVRADLANVEYRVEGALTGCNTVIKMFESNVDADPYCEAWFSMTGQRILKGMPIRQVSKSAVLGLGFQMSAAGYAKVLLKAIASGDVSLDMLMAIAVELKWRDPGRYVDDIVTKLGCDRLVALAAYHIHRSFQTAHPEFNMTAEWLVDAINAVSSSYVEDDAWSAAAFALERSRRSTKAPDPDMIYLDVDPDRSFKHPSVRVKCGPWVQTLCWREPGMRRTMFDGVLTEPKLSIRKANGTVKPFTKQLAIENVTQAAARNSLCYGLLQLEKMGYQDILHVHDEIILIVPKTRESVLKAREDMLAVYGAKAADKPLRWAVLVKPDEITVTQSLYEDENDIAAEIKDKKTGEKRPGPDRWGKIMRNEPGCLENLP